MKKASKTNTAACAPVSMVNITVFDQRLKDFSKAAKKVRAVAKKAMKNSNDTNDATRDSIGEKLAEATVLLIVLLPRLEKLKRHV